MATADSANAGANVIIQAVSEAEIDQAHAHAKKAMDMAVDDDSDCVSEASEVTDDVSLKDIMRNINTLKKQQKHDTMRSKEKTRVLIAEAVDPMWQEVRGMNVTLTDLSKASIAHDDRIGKLETEMQNLKVTGAAGVPQRDPHDPAYCQVAFKKFPPATSIDAKIKAMQQFMKEKFPELRFMHADIFYDKDGKPTQSGYVQFSTPKLARRVLDKVKAEKLSLTNFGDAEIVPATTAIDRNRNWALFAAEQLVKDDPKSRGKSVTVNKAKDRGVYVNKVQVFTQQPRYARDGQFVGEYKDLKLR